MSCYRKMENVPYFFGTSRNFWGFFSDLTFVIYKVCTSSGSNSHLASSIFTSAIWEIGGSTRSRSNPGPGDACFVMFADSL